MCFYRLVFLHGVCKEKVLQRPNIYKHNQGETLLGTFADLCGESGVRVGRRDPVDHCNCNEHEKKKILDRHGAVNRFATASVKMILVW